MRSCKHLVTFMSVASKWHSTVHHIASPPLKWCPVKFFELNVGHLSPLFKSLFGIGGVCCEMENWTVNKVADKKCFSFSEMWHWWHTSYLSVIPVTAWAGVKIFKITHKSFFPKQLVKVCKHDITKVSYFTPNVKFQTRRVQFYMQCAIL